MDNNEGIQVRVPFYGKSIQGVRCIIPYYTEPRYRATRNWMTVIHWLEKAGYKVGMHTDLVSAPYNFRWGPDDYTDDAFPKLKALVESVYESHGQRRVALTSISLGSMLVHTFLTHFVDQE